VGYKRQTTNQTQAETEYSYWKGKDDVVDISYRAFACHAGRAQYCFGKSVCPSVCLSVTLCYCIETKEYISSNYFHHLIGPRP